MKKRRIILAAAFAATLIVAGSAHAAGAYYYDGGTKRAITEEPGMVAEFGSKNRSVVKKARPDAAQVKSGVGGPRVYRVPFGSLKPVAGVALSPVFREGNSPAGRLMALPGGVVVQLRAEWDDGQVRAWASAKGYQVQQRLNITGNWYILKTDAGQASLDAANAIQESGEVISATPNWWMETATK